MPEPLFGADNVRSGMKHTGEVLEGGVTTQGTSHAGAVDGAVYLPDASFIAGAAYSRSGPDLEIVSGGGETLLVPGYFSASYPAPLIAPNNVSLDGSTVTLLAGPQYSGQYAQAGAGPSVPPIGKVEKLEGEVTAQRADGTLHTLEVGDLIFESDVISTGKGGLIGIKLSDGTVLSLQESGRLVLNEFVYDPNGSENKALLNVIEGTFSLFAGAVAPTGDMKIQTPIATLGIRGTSILGVDVSVLAGRLSLTQDPDGDLGFIEVFNNLNGDLFTILRTIFNKITLGDSGMLILSAKTPDELAFDQSLTQSLHDFYDSVPQAGPDTRPTPQTGSPFFNTPTFQDINFGAPPEGEPETLTIPAELLIPFIESLLQNPDIQQAIINALQEGGPVASSLNLQPADEATIGTGENSFESALPFSYGPSGPGTVGFPDLDEQPVTDAAGNPVTMNGTPLFYSWDAETNTLTAFAGEEPVFSIVVDPDNGAFTITILAPVDHPGTDNLLLNLDFTVVSANGQTTTGVLSVNIADDLPVAVNDVAVVNGEEPQTYNIGLILDVSGSMFGARLQLMKDAIEQLLENGNVRSVFLVTFASSASHILTGEGDAWFTDTGEAIDAVNALTAGGGTSYTAALNIFTGEESSYVAPPTQADQTVFYFLSDGIPGSPVNAALQADWEAFLEANGIDQAFAFGIGGGVSTANLFPIAYPNGDDSNPAVVTDESQLGETLAGTIVTTQNVLSGENNDDFGADGPGGIQSIVIDGFTYAFDGESITILDGNGQPIDQEDESSQLPDFYADGAILSVQTLLGGEFTFHFADSEEGDKAGDWHYEPAYGDFYEQVYYAVESEWLEPGNYEESLPYENFRYTIFDGDGDTSTASLTLVLDTERVDNVVQGVSEGEEIEGAAEDKDVLVGGLGPDTFVLNSINVLDYIADYESGEGDVIDLSSLLDGVNAENVSGFIRLEEGGDGAVDALQVDTTGTGDNFTTVALLNGDAGVNIIVDDSGPVHVANNAIA